MYNDAALLNPVVWHTHCNGKSDMINSWNEIWFPHHPGHDLRPASASPSSYRTGSTLSAVLLNHRHRDWYVNRDTTQAGLVLCRRPGNPEVQIWKYWPLASGWVSSAPTLPSTEKSVLSETGTNREVSGALGGELLEDTFLTRWCLCNHPDTWQLPPAVKRAARLLAWSCSRENNHTHRFTDMVPPPVSIQSVGNLQTLLTVAPYCSAGLNMSDNQPEDGQHISSSG